MPDTLEPLAAADSNAHDSRVEVRLAVLKEIASSTRLVLRQIRDDIRDLRNEVVGAINGLRSDMRSESKAIRDRQDADLRLVFGALIALALGVAGLMTKGFHWL